MTGIVIDIILVLIVVFSILTSAKKGFIRTLVEVVGTILVIYAVVSFSTPVADFIYTNTLEAKVVSSVEKRIDKQKDKSVDVVWDSFPEIVKNNADDLGISKNGLSKKLNSTAENSKAVAVKAVTSVAKPVIVKVISLCISVVACIVLLFAVRFLAKLLNKAFSFSVIGKINMALGGIFGIFKGIMLSFIFCMVICLLLSLFKDGFLIFSKESINSSYIFKFIYGLIPFSH